MPENTPTLLGRKLKRSAHLFYIDTGFDITSNTYAWKLIGKDVEDLVDAKKLDGIADEIKSASP